MASNGAPERAVAHHDLYVPVSDIGEGRACPLGELGDALDRDYHRSELGEHGCLVSRPGPDVEDPLAPLQAEESADRGDHERLRDRLVVSDRKRAVVISMPAQAVRHEAVARDASHRPENTLVAYTAAAQLELDHLCTRDGGVDGGGHFASVRSPANRAACRPRMRAARIGNATAST